MAKMIDCGTKPSAAKQQEEHERQEAAEQDRLYTATNLAAASAVWFASVNFNSCFGSLISLLHRMCKRSTLMAWS